MLHLDNHHSLRRWVTDGFPFALDVAGVIIEVPSRGVPGLLERRVRSDVKVLVAQPHLAVFPDKPALGGAIGSLWLTVMYSDRAVS